jgi:hypothetical protein
MPPITPQKPTTPSSENSPNNVSTPGGMPTDFGGGVAAVEQQKIQANLKTTEEKFNRTKLFLYISLGVGGLALIAALVFGFLYAQASQANSKKYDEGYGVGAEEQKKKDEDQALKDSLSDTRTYIAPEDLGSFQMPVPKSFSISTSKSNKDQLVLLSHPDKVDVASKELAIRLTVRDEPYSKVREKYDREVKEKRSGMQTSEEIKVSDRDAVRYVGKIDRAEKDGTLVLVKFLDKTILIQTDNNENTTLFDAYSKAVSGLVIP